MNRKRLIRVAAALTAVLMMTGSASAAELKRGDRSSEVAELQQMLFETGWLFETPDGIFGKNTEDAVKGFEAYANLPVDGIADDLMIYELSVSLDVLNEELGIIGGQTENTDGTEFSECCIQSITVDGSSSTDYCEIHHTLNVESYDMLESGDPELARIASDMWYEEVNRLYDQWAKLLPEAEQGGVLANRATFLAAVEAQRMAPGYGAQTDAQKIKTEVGICWTLRDRAAWLCKMIWDLNNGNDASEMNLAHEAVVLNSSVILEGNRIYYSGEIANEGSGIYVMDADGTNLRRISDVRASLKAVSNGNLLAWVYDDNGYGALEVIRADGTRETVGKTNSHAIADGGRFYYGGSSVAEDGSDHQWMISSDPEFHDGFYPIKVADGYLYYMDINVLPVVERTGAENGLPFGGPISRLELATGYIDPVTPVGTQYLGMEDGKLYYVFKDYVYYDENGDEVVIKADTGLFTAGLYFVDLEEMERVKLADLGDEENVFDIYEFVKDGVVYGSRFDFLENPDGNGSVLAVRSDGEAIVSISLNEERRVNGFYADNGKYYAIGFKAYELEDEYYTVDVLTVVDISSGEIKEIELGRDETTFYAETPTRAVVMNDSICFYVQNIENGAESLKVMDMDGGNIRTLIQGKPMY